MRDPKRGPHWRVRVERRTAAEPLTEIVARHRSPMFPIYRRLFFSGRKTRFWVGSTDCISFSASFTLPSCR